MGRSGPEFTTDADLAVGLFAPSRKDCSEADIAPGGRPHRQLPTGRAGHMAAAGRQNPERSSASAAWRAYRAPTPQDWFNLLSKDLSVLPQLPQTVLEVLEELPSDATGLRATEM